MPDVLLVLGFLLFVVLAIVLLVVGIRGVVKGPSPQAQAAVAAQQNALSVGGMLTGHNVRETDGFFEWRHPYGTGFKVPKAIVQAVTVERTGWGKATLKVIGAGAELAKVPDLPRPWAEQAQTWMMERLAQ